MNAFHVSDLMVRSESLHVLAKKVKVDIVPYGIAPRLLILHVSSKVVAVNVETDVSIELAGNCDSVDQDGDSLSALMIGSGGGS